jgi:uncharacterized protein (DUF2141 family)
MIPFVSFSQFTLSIEITGLRNNTGSLMLQVLDSTENIISLQKGTIDTDKCLIVVNDLKQGKYAVRYYHDENMNGKLDTNFVGKPTEGYGFSNNAYGTFGPSPFNDWLFEIKENKKILLRTKY